MHGQATGQVKRNLQQCIQECLDCHKICLETLSYCLQKGGQHAEVRRVSVLTTCAEVCQTSANCMVLGTDLYKFTCVACAEVCVQCATVCEQIGGDPRLQACAEACRRCAESCRQTASA
ncbi:MAG: putative cysteine-rich protein YhjQ [Acidobacteria bacterium]|nr:putative cysteine-rich protein YhjQ [Acidobacteriota bacterium]